MVFCTHLFKREDLRGFFATVFVSFTICTICSFCVFFFSKLVKAVLRFRKCVIGISEFKQPRF